MSSGFFDDGFVDDGAAAGLTTIRVGPLDGGS
jgi:hypothetical protein